LVLSLFPGVDLLGRGFEAEGFSVVRGPDLIFGGDVRAFHAPAGRFDGVMGGTPCPDFSRQRRGPPSGYGVEMIAEFRRLVTEARPAWWLLENVPSVPDVKIEGYSWLRIDLDARECGSEQSRPRHFQYGHLNGLVPVIRRSRPAGDVGSLEPCCMASEGSRPGRSSWARFCALQGIAPRELPGWSVAAKYRAVGNAVHFLVARTMAAGIRDAVPGDSVRLCACDCARIVDGRRVLATAACRKRVQRRRDAAGVTGPGPVTLERSRPGVTRRGSAVTDLSQRDGARSLFARSVTDPPAVTDLAAVTAAASLAIPPAASSVLPIGDR
jgi:DNA (cytosine-5)-methyltransferase 1